jgi:GR25 family glycosyltransferase involved in LPS biosynthesis
MKTLVITLPSAVERHAKIKNNFKLCNIDYSIVNGVSNFDIIFNRSSTPSYTFAGKTFEINHENLLKYTKRSWVRFGEIAALMAHYKIWKDLCNDPVNEVYLICEDDCFPSSEHIMSNLSKFDYSKLDFLYLQAVTAHYQNKDQYIEALPEAEWDKNLKIINTSKHYICEGLAAYCITKTGAEKLCLYIEQNGYDGPVDNIITRLENFECTCPSNLNDYFYLDDTSNFSYTHTGNFLNKYDLNGIELQAKDSLQIKELHGTLLS